MGTSGQQQLRDRLDELRQKWCRQGLPSRQQLEKIYDKMSAWKKDRNIPGLWQQAPRLLTATVDDGMGLGLDIIERFADLAGMAVDRLGLLQTKEALVAACRARQPEFLGLTVLRLDCEDDLAHIGRNIPSSTHFIAGGPVFKYDPELAKRCNITFVAGHVGHFIDYLLKWNQLHVPLA